MDRLFPANPATDADVRGKTRGMAMRSVATPEAPNTLHLGSGRDRSIAGGITVDISPRTSPHVLHDLNSVPWPFDDGTFDVIYCKDILEHLEDLPRTMEEIHRIARQGATVHITTPHFSSSNSYTDPTHRHHLGLFSFDYFTDQSELDYYSKGRFRLLGRRLFFHPGMKNPLLWRLANRHPGFYERHLAWIFPAWFMSFELEVLK